MDSLLNIKILVNEEIKKLKNLQRKAETKYRVRLDEKRLLLEQNAKLENEGKAWEAKENKKVITLIDQYKENSLYLSDNIDSFICLLHRITAIEEQKRLKEDLFYLSVEFGKIYSELFQTNMNAKNILQK